MTIGDILLQVSNDVIALSLSIFFGFVSLSLAVWFGISDKIRDFLSESKKGVVDEKIAMMYSYSLDVDRWAHLTNRNLMTERVLADIKSIGRLRRAIKDEQLEGLINARNALLGEMHRVELNEEATRIAAIFTSFQLPP